MALLGEGARPVAIDYSPMAESAWRMAQANSNAVGNLLDTVGDEIKERKEKKDRVKTGSELLDAAMKLYPETAAAYEGVAAKLKDEEIPLSERAALGAQVGDLINLGVRQRESAFNQQMQLADMDLSKRRVDLAEQQFSTDMFNASAAADAKTSELLNEAVMRGSALADIEQATPGLPKMVENAEMIAQAIEAGNGPAALAGIEAREKALEPYLGPQKLTKGSIGATGPNGEAGTMDVFFDDQGGVYDITGMPLPPVPGEDNMVLPPRDDVPQQASVPDSAASAAPRPSFTGFRPSGQATAKTPTEQKIDEAKLRNLEAQAANKDADLAKQTDAKATAKASAENALGLIDQLRKHPGFKGAVGMSMTPGFMPATDRKGAEAIINQLKGQAFLTAIQQLRGLGALSDAEGAKLQQAAVRLDANQSEKDFNAALSDYEKQIKEALGRLGGASEQSPAKSYSERLRALGF